MKQKLRTSFAVKQQNENLQLHGSLRVRLHGRFRSGGGSDVGNQQSSARRRRAWPKEKTHCKLFAPSAAAFLSPDMSFMTPLLILIFAYCMHIIVMLGLEHTHTQTQKDTLCTPIARLQLLPHGDHSSLLCFGFCIRPSEQHLSCPVDAGPLHLRPRS